jgi:hypothetical protein
MTELDTYAIPEAHDADYATGFGDRSVHEVATSQHEQGGQEYVAASDRDHGL